MDYKAIQTVNSKSAAGDISIIINKVDKTDLSEEVQAKVGDRTVYNFSIKAGSTEVSKFEGGFAYVSIPYTPKPGEKKNSIIVYYIDSTGKLKAVRGRYDSATGTVNFKTPHFSYYSVGYNEATFKDVANTAWYSEAVGFIAARGIVNGTGGGSFAPENKVTRADFLIMLMNSYGIELDTAISDNFADAGSKYYTKYLGTAKRLGLTSGIGNNLFAPTNQITRQEMFTLLYRTIKILGELPNGTGKELSNFKDGSSVDGWAKEAVGYLVKNGVVAGSNGKIYPISVATRAEAVQLFYNLLNK